MRRTSKQVIVFAPTSTTNGATTAGTFDTLGYDYATVDLIATTTNDATNNFSVLTLSESDDTVVTNFATISGFVGDTDFTIANGDASNPYGTKLNVDLRGRKRYLRLAVTPVTTQTLTAVANLSYGTDSPDDATTAGVVNLVEG